MSAKYFVSAQEFMRLYNKANRQYMYQKNSTKNIPIWKFIEYLVDNQIDLKANEDKESFLETIY